MTRCKTFTSPLSREACSALRGLAILCIVLHNFCHLIPDVVGESEYYYIAQNYALLRRHVSILHPLLPYDLLSVFGHYGVPLFLFVSGYGLVMKYETSGTAQSALRFTGHHYRKLVWLMAAPLLLYITVSSLLAGHSTFTFGQALQMLSLTANLWPIPSHFITPGPYWYFGMMMQIYLLYRLLLYRRHRMVTVLLMVLCTAAQALCQPYGNAIYWLRLNVVGSVLPFGLGVLYARAARHCNAPQRKEHGLSAVLLMVSLIAILLCSGHFLTWLLVPALVVVAGVSLVRLLPDIVLRLLAWMGSVSAALFVVHPTVRLFFLPIVSAEGVWLRLLLYAALSVTAAWLLTKTRRWHIIP